MGRHCAQRRKGTSLSGETTPPDPFVSQSLQTFGPSAQDDIICDRDSVALIRLYDITTVPELKETITDYPLFGTGTNSVFFTFFLQEAHVYAARVKCQFYPEHESNPIP